MKTPKIMLLHSVDGPEYTKALLIGETIADESPEELNELARNAIDKARAEAVDEWNFDDMTPHLQAAGFIVPDTEQVLTGPDWDE